ncbi:MAG: FecR domain-containing protein, partial [Bacteroidota bacterium]
LENENIKKEYDEVLKGYFDELILSEKKKTPETFTFDYNEKMVAAKAIVNSQTQKKRNNRKINFWSYTSGIAASLTFISCVLIAVWWFSMEIPDEKELSAISFEEKYIPSGKKGSLTLSDGSFIHLNSASKLSFPSRFSTRNRVVKMEGEAFFSIKRDEQRPFIIETSHTKIKVLGTSFNVKAYPEESEIAVTVKSGKVLVSNLRESTKIHELTKNQKLVFNTETSTFRKTDIEAETDLNWRKGILKFNQTPFAEIEKTLERWYGIEILVEDSSIYDKRITGIHKNENLRAVLESLEFAFGIKYKIEERTVKLKRL